MNTKRTLLALLFICACAWVDGDAHAQLKSSDPPAGALLGRAPKQVALRFTEAVELAFVQLTLYDDQGRAMPSGTLSVDPHDPTRILAALPPLDHGTYTVAWQATSASDGHVTRGTFPFSVGVVSDARAAVNTTRSELALGRVVTRWMSFLGLFSWLGGALFALVVLRRDSNTASTLARSRLLTLMRWGAGVVLLAELADFVYQAASVADASWWVGLNVERWWSLLNARYGQLAATRVAASALWLLLSWVPRGRFTSATLLGTALVLARSSSGHGAALAVGNTAAVLVDGLHLLTLSAWLGGLLALLWLWPIIKPNEDSNAVTRSLWLPRFSRLALGSMGVIVASGLYGAWRHLPVWSALWTSRYGYALLAKALLLIPVLLLAAPNLFQRVPRLKQEGFKRQTLARLQRSVRLEALLAALILAFGTLLTLLPPPASVNTPSPAAFEQTQTLSYRGKALLMTLRVTPVRVGPAHVEVTLRDEAGAFLEAQRVRLSLTTLERDLGASAVTLEAGEKGRYTAEGAFFSFAGRWRVEVNARFRGQAKDAEATFELDIG